MLHFWLFLPSRKESLAAVVRVLLRRTVARRFIWKRNVRNECGRRSLLNVVLYENVNEILYWMWFGPKGLTWNAHLCTLIYEVRNNKISLRENLKNLKMCWKDGVRRRIWSQLECIIGKFLFLNREVEAWVCKMVLATFVAFSRYRFEQFMFTTSSALFFFFFFFFLGVKALKNGTETEYLTLFWKQGIDEQLCRIGCFPAIRSWDQISRRNKEHSLRNSQFSVQLCTENQCN